MLLYTQHTLVHTSDKCTSYLLLYILCTPVWRERGRRYALPPEQSRYLGRRKRNWTDLHSLVPQAMMSTGNMWKNVYVCMWDKLVKIMTDLKASSVFAVHFYVYMYSHINSKYMYTHARVTSWNSGSETCLDEVRGLNIGDSILVMFLYSSCHGEDVGIKDDVIGIKVEPLDKKIVGPTTNLNLVLCWGSLHIQQMIYTVYKWLNQVLGEYTSRVKMHLASFIKCHDNHSCSKALNDSGFFKKVFFSFF